MNKELELKFYIFSAFRINSIAKTCKPVLPIQVIKNSYTYCQFLSKLNILLISTKIYFQVKHDRH